MSREPFLGQFWLPCLNTKEETHVTSVRDGTPNTSERLCSGYPCVTPLFLLLMFPEQQPT